ncbi:MAG: peroxiredoxin-like family protein [Pseudomonadota bacterium]
MSLQEKLDAFKVQFTSQVPAEAVEAFERSTRELIESGQAERTLKAGDAAPSFVLHDPDGNPVALETLLAEGPVVVSFYRGAWCPYCNLELQALEAVADDIRARGAQLVAISLQNAAQSRKSQRENGLSFPILSDVGGNVADAFGLRWRVQPYVQPVFRSFKVDLPSIHGDGQWNLPMPGRYVIDTDGTVAYAEVNPDYTRRPEPAELFPVLDALGASAAA